MTPADLVVVRCSRGKNPVVGPARDVYRGPKFWGGLKYAAAARAERVLVLSAKYGLLDLDDVIGPYNLRMDQPGAVSAGFVRWQAEQRGVLDLPNVHFAGGTKHYGPVVRAVWPHALLPLDGAGDFYDEIRTLRIARQRLERQATEAAAE